MAKSQESQSKETGIVETGTPQVPAYLKKGTEPVGVEDKGESRVTPRLKIVQKMAGEELVEAFGVGAVVLGDEQVEVCKPGESFVAVPLYQFPCWEVWKDVNDKASDNPVERVSFDPSSEIAQRAKARYSEQYGNGFTRSWIESLNFILHIETGDAAGSQALASWSKASSKFGRRLKGYLQRTGVDLFANRINFHAEKTHNAKGNWFVLSGKSAKPSFVSEADYEKYREMYDALDRAYRAGSMAPNVGQASESDTDGDE